MRKKTIFLLAIYLFFLFALFISHLKIHDKSEIEKITYYCNCNIYDTSSNAYIEPQYGEYKSQEVINEICKKIEKILFIKADPFVDHLPESPTIRFQIYYKDGRKNVIFISGHTALVSLDDKNSFYFVNPHQVIDIMKETTK